MPEQLLHATFRVCYFILWLVTLNNSPKPYVTTSSIALKENSKTHLKKECGLKFLNLNQLWKCISVSNAQGAKLNQLSHTGAPTGCKTLYSLCGGWNDDPPLRFHVLVLESLIMLPSMAKGTLQA